MWNLGRRIDRWNLSRRRLTQGGVRRAKTGVLFGPPILPVLLRPFISFEARPIVPVLLIVIVLVAIVLTIVVAGDIGLAIWAFVFPMSHHSTLGTGCLCLQLIE